MMRIQNESGSGCLTRIYDENGVEITKHLYIERVTMDMGGVYDVVRATLTIGVLKTEVNATLVEWITRHPLTKKFEAVASINFCDGSSVSFGEDGRATAYSPYDEKTGIAKVAPYGDKTIRYFRAPADESATSDCELKTPVLNGAS